MILNALERSSFILIIFKHSFAESSTKILHNIVVQKVMKRMFESININITKYTLTNNTTVPVEPSVILLSYGPESASHVFIWQN